MGQSAAGDGGTSSHSPTGPLYVQLPSPSVRDARAEPFDFRDLRHFKFAAPAIHGIQPNVVAIVAKRGRKSYAWIRAIRAAGELIPTRQES